jgi:hypothetical protein
VPRDVRVTFTPDAIVTLRSLAAEALVQHAQVDWTQA